MKRRKVEDKLLIQIVELFEGNRKSVLDWFTNPNRALGGHSPLEISATKTGTKKPEQTLRQF